MNATSPCKPRTRPLYPWEVEAAQCVFAGQLLYERIRIHECTTLTNTLDRIGRRLKGLPPQETQNAITLGNHCYFPVMFPEEAVSFGQPEHYKICWLIHELTHAWQYQHLGWRYLVLALSAQFRLKGAAYDFGGADGLKLRRAEMWTIRRFNLEQQGDITRSYYERMQGGQDVNDWLPYIQDIQNPV